MSNTTPNAGPLTLLQAAEVSRWYDEYAPHLRRILAAHLLSRAQDTADIDDVIHETFIRLMRHVTEVAALSSDKHRWNYVMQTAHYVVTDRYRANMRRFREATPLSALANDDHTPMEPMTASHDWQAAMQPEQTTAVRMSLRAVWEATPHEYREVLLLLASGMKPAQMAHTLHITPHAVAVRVYRLRAVLREAGERIV